jgi:competence protein ComEC
LKEFPALRYLGLLVAGIFIADNFVVPKEILFFGFSVSILSSIVLFFIPKFSILKYFPTFVFLFLGIFCQQINNDKNDKTHIVNQQNIKGYLVSINSYTETKPKTFKVTCDVLAYNTKNKWQKVKGKSLLYFNKEAGVYPQFGEIYLINGQPRQIEPPKNPLEFNYSQFQSRKNIFTHHFLRNGDFKYLGKKNISPLFSFANGLSLYTHAVFKKTLDTPQQLGVAEALIAGIKSELDQETLQAYSDTGAIHVLSVSGMHVGILFLAFSWLLSKVLNPKKLWFTVIVLVLLWLYALFTGLSPSVCRATLMFSMIQIGLVIKRDNNTLNTLFMSALILLIINPNWIFDVGFQLSYLAVLGIVVLYPKLRVLVEIQNRHLRWLYEISAVSFAAQLFTFPLSIYYFHQFPNYFLLTNPFVAIISFPLLPIGVVLIFVSNVPFLGYYLGVVFKYLLIALNKFIVFAQHIPNSVSKGMEISPSSVVLLYALIVFIILFFEKRQIVFLKLATIVVLVLVGTKFYKISLQNNQKEITFHYIPNGQGISFVSGRNASFLSSDSLINDPKIYQFHLKNYYDHAGINSFKTVGAINAKNIKVLNEVFKLQWIHGRTKEVVNQNADFVVCSNNAIKDLVVFERFKGQIIIDGSNKKWVVEKLKQQALENNINLTSLYDSGSKTVKF